MAKRRMFSSDIVDSDKFLDMPVSARCLYYDLGMRADDDGFVGPKKILRLTGASDDDLKVLIAKGFVIPFKSGVLVIKDWKMNNYIQKDRYSETIYKTEKSQLSEDTNGSYILKTKSIQDVYKLDTQVRLGKVRLGKDSIDNIYTMFLEKFNSICNSKYRGNEKIKKQLNARLKEGFTIEEIFTAIEKASKSKFLMGKNEDKKKYLSPEYITRADKLDQWLNNGEEKNFESERKVNYF